MTKDDLIIKWEKEIEYLLNKQSKLPKEDTMNWNWYSKMIDSISKKINDIRNLSNESKKTLNIMQEKMKEIISQLGIEKKKLIEVRNEYPYMNNVEYELMENIERFNKLISELEIVYKLLC